MPAHGLISLAWVLHSILIGNAKGRVIGADNKKVNA